ncbi:MAG: cysteine hydrolase [Nanoarchaeota archaeon]|nr:cysteine hydrolase [Nanoarchaeota archaeon]MBU1643789.1 cysteine hydrolase [Nanoarchaeota archaeon]MBU1977060.1 cysteine hydrolase [Nanoarchaeota archaeon]
MSKFLKLSKAQVHLILGAALYGCTSQAVLNQSAEKYPSQLSLEPLSGQGSETLENNGLESKVAVILIDMQDFFLTEIAEKELAEEIPYQIEVLEYSHKNKLPVFVLEYNYFGDTTKILKEKLDTLEDVKYIVKTNDDGFEDTSLTKELKDKNVETVLLMGVKATACVLSTAQSALKNGFEIMTSKQLIANKEYYVPGIFGREAVGWYKKVGIHRDNFRDLLKIISERRKKEQQSL